MAFYVPPCPYYEVGMGRSAVMFAQGVDVEDGGLFENLFETAS